jgi:hypothetical protein
VGGGVVWANAVKANAIITAVDTSRLNVLLTKLDFISFCVINLRLIY